MEDLMKENTNIFTIVTSDGFYLAFDKFTQAAYCIADLSSSDEIILQKICSSEMAYRYLQGMNIYRQIYYRFSTQFELYNLPPIDKLPYGVKGEALPHTEKILNPSNNCFYEVMLSDNRYFILGNLSDVANLISNSSNISYVKIKRHYEQIGCVRHILAYDALVQVLNGQQVRLINPPSSSETMWGAQGSSLNQDISVQNFLPHNIIH